MKDRVKMVILLYSLACVLFLLGMGSDVFFRLHRLSLALTIVAVLLMLMAHRLRKRQFEGTVVDSLVQRQKQFQRLLLGAAAGSLGGYIILRWQLPQLHLVFAMATSILTFALVSVYFYWRCFLKLRD